MVEWTLADVIAASKAIDDAWPKPADTVVIENSDFSLLCRPAHLSSPTSGRVQVRIQSQRPFPEIRIEVEQCARERGANEVWWWVGAEADAITDGVLRSFNADLVVTELLMARSLTGADADAWLAGGNPSDSETSVVDDEASFMALTRVETAGWVRTSPSDEVLIEEWNRLRAELISSSAYAFVARAEGVPASAGRCALFGPVVRLFGAVTLPEFRGRGLYGSILMARCRLGREHGATLALTRGRPATSAPILARAGFDSYQTDKCWRLRIDGNG